jgi:hypothetical protein
MSRAIPEGLTRAGVLRAFHVETDYRVLMPLGGRAE